MAREQELKRQELAASVARDREELVDAWNELSSAFQGQLQDTRRRVAQARERLDVRRQIRTRPWTWVFGGFGLGLLLGSRQRFSEMLREAGF